MLDIKCSNKIDDKGNEVFALSHSSGNKYLSCQYQYACEKIYQLPYDEDIEEDTKALRWGKTVHSVMEWTEWAGKNFTRPLHAQALEEQGFMRELPSGKKVCTDDQVAYATFAAVVSLYEYVKKQKLKTIKCEFEINFPYLYGFIDSIVVDAKGYWWIRDLKTASSCQTQKLKVTVRKNKQINLYALPEVVDAICDEFGLDKEKFAGCLYTVVNKTKAVPKSGESLEDFAKRTKPKVTEFAIKATDLDPEEAKKVHMQMIEDMVEIRSGRKEPIKNFEACYEWNRPCPFWSKCRGKSYTEELNIVDVYDSSTVKNMTITKSDEIAMEAEKQHVVSLDDIL